MTAKEKATGIIENPSAKYCSKKFISEVVNFVTIDLKEGNSVVVFGVNYGVYPLSFWEEVINELES